MARRAAEGGVVERRIEALFDEEPDEFVGARDALARELAASRDGRARDVKALRRPTVLAWALNRLARREAAGLAGLLEAGERLRAGHAAALRGGGAAALREADRAVSAALDALVAAARRDLEGAGHAPTAAALGRLRGALREAASSGAASADALLRGRFEREPEGGGGVGALTDGGAALLAGRAAPSPELARRAPAREEGRPGRDARRASSPELSPPGRAEAAERKSRSIEARAQRREQARQARALREDRVRAEKERKGAAAALARAEAVVVRREREAGAAERRAAVAQAALDAARAAVETAQREVEPARRRLDEAERRARMGEWPRIRPRHGRRCPRDDRRASPARARYCRPPVLARRKRILVVEDDGDLREELASFITELGVEVLQARDGLEGLEQLASGPPPAAILLDMWMPRLDGPGFLAALRGEPHLAEIPVVTMTGGPEPLVNGQVATRLQKPFDVEELARIMVSLCDT